MSQSAAPSLLPSVLLAAMAGGMGWGIRGQYGHETGAMMAGALVGLVLVLLFCPRHSSLWTARAVAFCTLGISIGGAMTYGQTVGLTHDPALVGNVAALSWGLLGLFIKGGIWIGFAALFLSIGLSQTRYCPGELALLLLVAVFCWFLGVWLLNEPFDPESRRLPTFYFSADWRWQPESPIDPRREVWGGQLLALLAMYFYAAGARGDRLARRLVPWGMVGGGLGFSLGQCIQAYHAWNLEAFRSGWFATLEPHINWWNMMETTFGAIMGGMLALGLWLNRRLLPFPEDEETLVELSPLAEWTLAVVHVAAIAVWNFAAFTLFDAFADITLSMVLLPAIAVSAGRFWPYLLTLPIVTIPIAGKTLRQLSYHEAYTPVAWGWALYVALPVTISLAVSVWLARRANDHRGRHFARWALLVATWTYFALNFAFFHLPWPWLNSTARTPNGLIFAVCALGLTVGAIHYGRERSVNGSEAAAGNGTAT